jgi:hypothetical protein
MRTIELCPWNSIGVFKIIRRATRLLSFFASPGSGALSGEVSTPSSKLLCEERVLEWLLNFGEALERLWGSLRVASG